jgi:hypothetical protein
VILMGLPLYVVFSSLTAFNILFSVLVVLLIICFVEVLFWSSLYESWRLPVPEWALFSQDLGKFLLLFCEYITNSFCLHLFSFFNAHDSQVWSFDGVSEFLHIPFTGFELFD